MAECDGDGVRRVVRPRDLSIFRMRHVISMT